MTMDIELVSINGHSNYATETGKRSVFGKVKNNINFSYTVFQLQFES